MLVLDVSYFDQIYAIMEEAFPKEERRTYEDQKALLLREDYHIVGHVVDGVLQAFLAYYDEKEYCFVEHLATSKAMRGSGVGKILLLEFLEQCSTCVLFEVELPDTDIAKRRIAFYKRLGCYIYPEVDYVQPALQKGVRPLPLHIMSTQQLEHDVVEEYCKRLHHDIYQMMD